MPFSLLLRADRPNFTLSVVPLLTVLLYSGLDPTYISIAFPLQHVAYKRKHLAGEWQYVVPSCTITSQ